MGSSTTSSIHKSKNFKYDVFLSFRGEDTRTNFVDHLYHALRQKSIHTYKDDQKIKKGENISGKLIGSIEDSKFYIIVFSKNYASSSWCLDELVKIMECQRMKEHTAYPVFYDVEPSEVRNQTGAVAEAFAKHEKEASARKWRDALKEAGDLAGWELKKTADGYESKFIQMIVEELSLELRYISFNIDEKLVGMESRINDVLSSLDTDTDDVRMMGIKGIGGGGKTTLARAVFDHISFQFEGKSFIENVREVSNTSLFGLKSLQTQILVDVFNDKGISVSSVSEGKHLIRRRICDKKVIVVLDDVDHIDQLEALAGEPSWFKPGSRIIITTRDEQVLVAHQVKFIRDVNLLSDDEALILFSKYAFGRKIQVQEYEELARQVIGYAAGLPLTIRVLGSFLCGKNELEWIDVIERLKTIPLKETLKKLELSYISLEEDYKEMFLDIACIMKGWLKDYSIKVLECCGFHARNGLKVLEQKSLITIYTSNSINDNYEYVGMHDHMEEMGRSIVRRSHPNKPHKHTRLWIYEEIENVLANDLGTKATRCIRLDTQEHNRKFDMKGLRKMKELRFLSVGAARNQYWDSNIANPEFPNALRYLRLKYYPFRSLPITFQADNLVALEMVSSKIVQLWDGGEGKVLKKLKILDLRGSMLSTLDLRVTPNIETLDLGSCVDLVELHMPVECLKLMHVNLEGSWLIKTLDLRLAPNIKKLILNFCNDLETLLMPSRCLNLIYLRLTNSKVRTLDIGQTPNLWTLDLEDCHYLEKLNMEYQCQKLANLDISHSKLRTVNLGMTPNLEKLKLKDCDDLVELYTLVDFLKLTYVNLEGSSLRTLDLSLAPNLENLILNFCNDLEELHMPNRCLNLRNLQLTNSKVRTLNIGQAPNLRNLNLEKNKYLEELNMENESKMLANVDISHSKLRTLDLGQTPNLHKLYLGDCHYLEELHMDGECQKLINLDISHSKLRTLDLGLAPNVEILHLEKCYNLVELRPPIGGLKKLVQLDLHCLRFKSFSFREKDYTFCSDGESLEVGPLAELHLTFESLESCSLHPDNSFPKFQFICIYEEHGPSLTGNVEMLISIGMCACTNLETVSKSICGLRHLTKLKLEGSIVEVPKDLYKLEYLENLDLSYTKIKHLPDSICMLKHLKSLKVLDCGLLEKLPEDLGCLEHLRELDVGGTSISHLPQSILLLKGLHIFGSRELLESCGFSSQIQTSEYIKQFCYIVVE